MLITMSASSTITESAAGDAEVVLALEGDAVDELHDRDRRVVGAALGEDVELLEREQRARDAEHGRERERRACSSGSVMLAEGLPAGGAVDAGGLVDVVGDALQAHEHEQHVEARVAPHDEEDRRPQRAVGRAEEREAPRRHQVGERAGDRRVEHVEEQRCGCQAEGARHEERGAQERPSSASTPARAARARGASASRMTVVRTVYFRVNPIESQKNRFVDGVLVVLGEVPALVAAEQRPVRARHLQHEQQRQHEQEEHEERGRRGVEPAGDRAACGSATPAATRRRAADAVAASGRQRRACVAVIVWSRSMGPAVPAAGTRRLSGAGRAVPDYCESTAVISSLSASTDVAVAEHRVAHERQPRAVRRVERLLEVDRDRGVAVGGHLVDRDEARVLVGVLVARRGRNARPRPCSSRARRPGPPRTSSS